jgi:hypothetical protein
VSDDQRIAVAQLIFQTIPLAGGQGEISLDHSDLRVVLSEDHHIPGMLVYADDFSESPGRQARNEVLSYEPCGPRDYDLF